MFSILLFLSVLNIKIKFFTKTHPLQKHISFLKKILYNTEYRGVAQSGSAPALGAGCRRFKSSRPDVDLHISIDFSVFFNFHTSY